MRDKSKISFLKINSSIKKALKFSSFLLIAFLLFSGGNVLAKDINFGTTGDKILLNGNVGIGITNPSGKLNINQDDTIDKVNGGNIGNLNLTHPTSGGMSAITFKSTANWPSDGGYLAYYDDNNTYAYWGDTAENSALVLGVTNDTQGSPSDVVVLKSLAAAIIDAPSLLIPTGNVGIGKTNPATALDVNGVVTATSFSGPMSGFLNAGNVSNGAFGSNSGGGNYSFPGNVGIGVAIVNASNKLDVVGGGVYIAASDGHADASLHITTSYGGFDRLTQVAPTGVSKPGLNLMGSTDAASANHWWVWGPTSADVWRIQSGTGFSGSAGLSIDNAGNVGIGTSAPSDFLTLDTGATRKGITIKSDGSADAFSDITLIQKTYPTTGNVFAWDVSHRKDGYFSGSTSGSLEFYGIIQGGGYYAPLSFKNNGDVVLVSPKNATTGNVGVGTTNPLMKLDVKGNAQFDDTGTYTSYSWAGGTLQTNSVEILDKVGGSTGDGIYPTLTFHDYGNGGAQFSMEGLTTTLHLGSGQYNSAGTLAGAGGYFSKLKIWGALETTGAISLGGSKINNLGTPTSASDAATKGYVDSAAVASAGNADTVDGLHAASFWQDNQGRTIGTLYFTGVGGDSGQAAPNSDYRIYQAPGPWAPPFPDLNIAYHTGISIGAHYGYGGTRFFNNSDMVTKIFSVGEGDNHVRVVNNLYVGGTVTAPTFSGALSGNANTATTANYANSAGSAGSATTAGSSGYSNYLSPNYAGGQQLNPQTYFNSNIGLKVAMTASLGYWFDTVWINGYAGSDVPNMIALHTSRNGEARMWLSSQPSNSTSFGTAYEFITSRNIASQTVSNSDMVDSQHFSWSNADNNPSYLWGANSNGSSFLAARGSMTVYNVTSLAGTWSGLNYFLTNNGGYAVNNSNSAALEAYSTGNNSAFMSFHRGGYYAVNFGLDQDNVMRIGGWSAPANLWQLDMGGNQTIAGGMWATAYTYSSDINLKQNITTIQNPLEKILQLRGVTFDWKKDNKPSVGLIAQEVEKVFPELVVGEEGKKGVQYGNLVAPLIEAVKEQQKEIEELKAGQKDYDLLKIRINNLEAKSHKK